MGSSLSSFYCSSSSASRPPPPPPSLPLPPPSSPQIKYDVFLSFRGEDTRASFVSHLHKALVDRGFETFIDYNLNRGDEISPALLTAIEESRISIVIFSKEYASSTWCLEELMKILECKNRETNKQIVIPVFYEVDPSDVRNQTGSFAGAFAKHEKRFKKNPKQIHRWKDALKEAANLAGCTSSSHKLDAEFIKVIVEDVKEKLDYLSPSDTGNFVGIDSKVEKIESLLCMGTNDVCSVGIWGIGGIGKTTLAEAVFNKIAHQFKGCSYFVRNVREQCEQRYGLTCLQRDLLSALLGDKHANINVHATGRTFIKKKLGHKKLLIVFDDVSNARQIKGLIGGFDCLGPQSRIIITTRDKQVLTNCEVNQVYEVQELINHEALKLFCSYAFRRNHPIEDYMKLSQRVVEYAKGIPLALRVLGSHLCDKEIDVWKSAIAKMERLPHVEIYEALKISYDGLDDEQQNVFLDIACFLKSSGIEVVELTLDACGFAAKDAISVLIDKSLIVRSGGTITMHDLLEAMAKEIVRQESIEDPGKRSRLWDHEEIYHALTKNTCTATIKSIALDLSKIRNDIQLNPCDFEKMTRLRLLKLYNSSYEGMNRVHVSEGVKYNFAALRYLSLQECPIKSSWLSFSLENLVILDMRESKVEQLWNGFLPLPKLKKVDFENSYLTSCPDFSGSPNLEKLNLSWCKNLCEISRSVGRLDKLDDLALSFCTSLKTIPDFSGLISLKRLYLLHCPNLETLHEMPCNLESFNLNSSIIEELPLSFGNLSRLRFFMLDGCEKIKRLPSSICKLKSLQALQLVKCSGLDQLPEDVGCLSSLEVLSAIETSIRELPSSTIHLKKLRDFAFTGLFAERLGDDDYCRSNIRLDLSESMIIRKCLPKLQLRGRPLADLELFGSLIFKDCTTLADFEDIVKKLHALQKIEKVSVELVYPGNEVPKWFNFKSLGDSINVELSPNWLNKSFIGFALCAVVAPYRQEDFDDSIMWTWDVIPEDPTVWTWCDIWDEREYWDGYIGETFLIHGGPSNRVLVWSPCRPKSLHKLCDAKEISFEIETLEGHFKIEKCGVHLMYGQDIEEVNGSSYVGEDENTLCSANIHDNWEVDEPHPKRLKKTPN